MCVLQELMTHPLLDSARRLSDAELLRQLNHLAARERDATARMVAHLVEVESRELHLKGGYGALFEYCRLALCFSEHEAYNRCAAAHAAGRFPVILDMLTDGSINLTTVRLLAGHLTTENHRGVLESARGKRKVQVEEIVAALAPRPDLPTSMRKLPAILPAAPAAALSFAVATPTPTSVAAPLTATSRRPQATITAPLAPDRYRLQVTISGEAVAKLRLAAEMLGHAVPDGDGAEVIDRALTSLLRELARKRFAGTEHPRRSKATVDAGSRYIAAEIKRAVWVRDLGRCAFVGSDRRCDERRFLEFHHVKPYAVGGPATVDNIQLRCRRHNQHEAKLYFGRLDDSSSAGQVKEEPSRYCVAARASPVVFPFYPFRNGSPPASGCSAANGLLAYMR